LYLAVIAALVVVIVYASAKAVRAHRVLAAIEERFGLAARGSSVPRGDGAPLRRLAPADLLRPRTLDEYRREVDDLIARAGAAGEFGADTRLAGACGAALAGGKRLRAIILLEVARATSVRLADSAAAEDTAAIAATPVDAAEAALFVEYIHTASLVIDDTPAFDNDDRRRGRPALHAAEGTAVATLAAVALLAAAFQNMCRQLDWIRDNCPEVKNVDRIGTRICSDVSRALGAAGAAGGQCMDVATGAELAEHGPDAVADLVYRKTATFFETAVVAGWLVAGGAPAETDAMRDIGRGVGTAFQIADDITDMAADAARAASGRSGWNFANTYGRDVAAAEVERCLRGARLALRRAHLWTALWEDELFPAIRAMAAAPAPALRPLTGAAAAAAAAAPGAAPAPTAA